MHKHQGSVGKPADFKVAAVIHRADAEAKGDLMDVAHHPALLYAGAGSTAPCNLHDTVFIGLRLPKIDMPC
jgi:hypothetical protein